MNKLSIRWRMTLLSVLLLFACCVGLTIVLNYSAGRMADTLEAAPLLPGALVGGEELWGSGIQAMPATISIAARRSFLKESIVWVSLIVFAGGALTYYVAGRALQPLAALSAQMKNRTVHNLSEVLPAPQSGDEVASLTLSFNDMSAKLDDAFSMQRRFAQSAAHELRTPLAVMKAKLQVFHKKKGRTPAEYEELLSGVEFQTDRLSALVGELLEFTCMEPAEHAEKISLQKIFSELAEELSPVAKEREVALSVNCAPCEVQGNENLLYRAFYNLLENAIKYNRVGGQVFVAAAPSEGEITVTVSDTGQGIPPEQRELIFEPFYRVDKSRSRQNGGAGLGLSTVRQILRQHGGAVSVSESEAGGSVFTVTLPSTDKKKEQFK